MSQRRPAALVIALAALAACASGQRGEPQPMVGLQPSDSQPGIQLTIENETGRSVRVFAREGGDETLLGRVDALSDRSVRLPHAAAGTVTLVARGTNDAGDRGHVSEPVTLMRGHRITWELRASPGSNGPRFSTIRVFRCRTEAC